MTIGAAPDIQPDKLLGLARTRSIASRATLAASLSDLYFNGSSDRSDREKELMAEVLQNLIRDVDTCMREVLVRNTAPSRIPASDMARVLGSDNANEVHKTLRESGNLTDDDLVAVARRRSDDYRRAIAERDGLTERVTDAIVAVADDAVILRLVANQTAALSVDAVELLISRSADAPALQALLLERPELSSEQINRLGMPRSAAAPQSAAESDGEAKLSSLPKWLRRGIAEGTA
ncbi:MAG: DUF2336 domain-containing protein [Alphaproteobacteria bacterium]|nr:DUF2336 domain-containing protein [Alphaproteobacteria bacterium]